MTAANVKVAELSTKCAEEQWKWRIGGPERFHLRVELQGGGTSPQPCTARRMTTMWVFTRITTHACSSQAVSLSVCLFCGDVGDPQSKQHRRLLTARTQPQTPGVHVSMHRGRGVCVSSEYLNSWCVWRCFDGEPGESAESSEPPPPPSPTGLLINTPACLERREITGDNEACGEAAAAASVCDIERTEGRTLSDAFDFLAIFLFMS